MRAREALMQSDLLETELENLFPICTPGASDTAAFDECLELLVLAGYPLQEAVLMMIPEPWENHEGMDQSLKISTNISPHGWNHGMGLRQ